MRPDHFTSRKQFSHFLWQFIFTYISDPQWIFAINWSIFFSFLTFLSINERKWKFFTKFPSNSTIWHEIFFVEGQMTKLYNCRHSPTLSYRSHWEIKAKQIKHVGAKKKNRINDHASNSLSRKEENLFWLKNLEAAQSKVNKQLWNNRSDLQTFRINAHEFFLSWKFYTLG